MQSYNNLSDFIGNSSLSKTLRNRLIPVGKTQENIEKSGIMTEDALRAEKRNQLKQLMNDYYRWFINNSLKDFKTEWSDYFELIEDVQKGIKDEKELKEIEGKKRKEIFAQYSKNDDFKNIFSAKIITSILPEFVKNNPEYSINDKEEYLKTIELFSRFTTSFTDFFNNRKNVFSQDEISSSSCYRVVNVNAKIFYDNMKAFGRIKRDMKNEITLIEEESDNRKALNDWSLEHIFISYFYNYLVVQSGIDFYNEICGRINYHINLYCQKNKMNKNLYKMRKLQKQILSITNSSFDIPEQFENDEELYRNVNSYLEVLRTNNVKDRLHTLGTNVEEYDLSKIFIPNKSFSTLSVYLCKDWEEIEFCLSKYFEQTIKAKSGKEEKVKKMIKTVSSLSLLEIEKLLDEFSLKENRKNVRDYLSTIVEIADKLIINDLKYDSDINLIEDDDKIKEIKTELDSVFNIIHWQKNFIISEEKEKDITFYMELNSICDEISDIVPLYNKVRNYVTRKPYSVEKMKLNFGIPTLADGWSKSKEYSNNAVLFIKNEKYFLGIFNPKNKPEKQIMEGSVERKTGEDYKKVVYNLLPGPNKMLPKVFISSNTGKENYHPSDYILEGYNLKRHIKSSNTFDIKYCHDLIDYFKDCIQLHPEWKNFNFEFSNTDTYQDISEFYKEVTEQGYKIDFCYISKDDMESLVDAGQIFLFQIYNKDFAPGKKGNDNLHTMYLKNLFSEENLKDVVLKLNGQAELFYRKSSIKKPIVHKEGSVLLNKTYQEKNEDGCIIKKTIPDDLYQELYMFFNGKKDKLSAEAEKIKDKCNYYPATMDIVKDKRFTVDQYYFHCPITINFKAQNKETVNQIALRHIANSNNINVIGIDRGERNLIYVSVINGNGEILKQKSFNIVNDYNYKEKLDQKERGRQDARKNWKEIGKIKDLKEGYLSQVIHEIVQMMIEYHAIIVMEDLNRGFKRGRFKVEKQVYQKFETMLIDKLNYLVDKNKPVNENGGLLRGFQLSYVPDSLSKLGRQCGMIFYVPAAYTSKIDPTTGFVDVFRHKELTSGARKKDFLLKFDEICYDSEKNMFAFLFDYDNFATYQTKLSQKKWQVYTNGERIVKYIKDGYWVDKVICPTEMIMNALDKKGIDYKDGHNILEDIKSLDDRKDLDIISSIQYAFRSTVTMRNSLTNDESYDRIISPVINQNGTFFDSMISDDKLPADADANGAYHIALKGLYLVNQIQNNWYGKEIKSKDVFKIDNGTWFDYVQNQKYKE